MNYETLFAPGASVVVIGDVMLDGYVKGEVSRISPEAPVPVLRHINESEVPGGAANVALNIVTLGGRCSLIGVVGNDDVAARLSQTVETYGVETSFVVDDGRPTTHKLRVLAGSQQMLRLDREVATPVAKEIEDQILAVAEKAFVSADVLVLSDYAKGCLTDRLVRELIARARAADVVVLVDPKRKDFKAYHGAHFVTPNRSELTLATGISCADSDGCHRAARLAYQDSGASLLLTKSEAGIALYVGGEETVSLPAAVKQVYDVSGAGDTVIAAFALGLASKQSPERAVYIANSAAGVAVSRMGTAAVTASDVLNYMRHLELDTLSDFRGPLTLEAAKQLRDIWQTQGLRVGFTNGCFDLVHPGHIRLLEQARSKCDRLFVGLNSDASVSRLKGPTRPVQSEVPRATVLSALSSVDGVVIFDEDTPFELIKVLMPDVLIKGADYTEDQIVGADLVKGHGGSVVRVEIVEGQSTSNLVKRIANA